MQSALAQNWENTRLPPRALRRRRYKTAIIRNAPVENSLAFFFFLVGVRLFRFDNSKAVLRFAKRGNRVM